MGQVVLKELHISEDLQIYQDRAWPHQYNSPVAGKDKILLCAISRVEKEDNIKRQQLADNAAIGQTIRNILLLLGKYFEEKISKILPIFLLSIF